VYLFSLVTTANSSALNTTKNGIASMNVPAWVSMVHAHHRLAMVSIGGSTDQNWNTACEAPYESGLATNLANYIVSNGFDGVDIDVEQGGWSNGNAAWTNWVQTIAAAVHAVKMAAGPRMSVTTESTTSWIIP